MARRQKSSVFEDLIHIAAKLPWQAGVGLAIVTYLVFHLLAAPPPKIQPSSFNSLTASVGPQLIAVMASLLQYVVPMAFLIGAAASAFGKLRRRHLHDTVSRAPSRNALESMSWREFEALVGETFARRGFRVVQRGGNGPDGGVDLELHLGSDKYLVQCKQWKTRSVGVATVRELFGVMTAEGAVAGFVVASGDFTEEAKRFVEGREIELVSTDSLLQLIQTTSEQTPVPKGASANQRGPVCCPQCGSAMVRRTARQGSNQGQTFWGCSGYPVCRGTRAI